MMSGELLAERGMIACDSDWVRISSRVFRCVYKIVIVEKRFDQLVESVHFAVGYQYPSHEFEEIYFLRLLLPHALLAGVIGDFLSDIVILRLVVGDSVPQLIIGGLISTQLQCKSLG